jgi:hypothetical protein
VAGDRLDDQPAAGRHRLRQNATADAFVDHLAAGSIHLPVQGRLWNRGVSGIASSCPTVISAGLTMPFPVAVRGKGVASVEALRKLGQRVASDDLVYVRATYMYGPRCLRICCAARGGMREASGNAANRRRADDGLLLLGLGTRAAGTNAACHSPRSAFDAHTRGLGFPGHPQRPPATVASSVRSQAA